MKERGCLQTPPTKRSSAYCSVSFFLVGLLGVRQLIRVRWFFLHDHWCQKVVRNLIMHALTT